MKLSANVNQSFPKKIEKKEKFFTVTNKIYIIVYKWITAHPGVLLEEDSHRPEMFHP